MYVTEVKWKSKRTTGMLLMSLGVASIIQVIPLINAYIFLNLVDIYLLGGTALVAIFLMAVINTEVCEKRSLNGINIDFHTIVSSLFWISIIYLMGFFFIVPILQAIFSPVDFMNSFSNDFTYFFNQFCGIFSLSSFYYFYNKL